MRKKSSSEILDIMEATGLLPIFYNANAEIVHAVIKASYDAGIRVFEFTNRGPEALEIFKEIVDYFDSYKDLIIGVGTLWTVASAREFYDAGAQFLVSPGLVPEIGNFSREQQILWIPGCGSVTEVKQAQDLGAKLVKIYPANVLGTAFIKSVKAVLPDIKLIPTGGVHTTSENLEEWFRAGVSCVGMGSQLITKNILENKDYEQLEESIASCLTTIKRIR